MTKSKLRFDRTGNYYWNTHRITAVNVTVGKIVWNYMCWVLAGKPKEWVVKDVEW